MQRLLDIISGVELRSPDSGSLGSRGLGVSRESATILGLDCPQAALVIRLGPAVAADAPDQLLVPASSDWLGGHCCRGRAERGGTQLSAATQLYSGVGEKVLPACTSAALKPEAPNPNVMNERSIRRLNSSISVHSSSADRVRGILVLHHLCSDFFLFCEN